jgi:hypothetical protein
MRTSLEIDSTMVRIYADAVRKVFASTLSQNDEIGEALRLLLSFADATATCAENMSRTQAQMLELAQIFGAEPSRKKFGVIEGGKR